MSTVDEGVDAALRVPGRAPDAGLDTAVGQAIGLNQVRQRSALIDAALSNPDQAGEAAHLAKRYGTPPEPILGALPEVKARAAVEDASAKLGAASHFARFVADKPFVLKQAIDDLDALGAFEKTLIASTLAATREQMTHRSAPAQQPNPDGSIRAYSGPPATLGNALSGLAGVLPQFGRQVKTSMNVQMDDALAALGFPLSDQYRAENLRRAEQARAQAEGNTLDFGGNATAEAIYGGLVSTVQQAPGIAAAILTGGLAAPLLYAGAATQAMTYPKYRARGGTAGEALVGSVGEGVVEIATELPAMGFIINKFGKTGARQFIAGLLVRDVPGEQVATFVQDAIDTAVANPDKTWAEFLAERPDAAYSTLVSTVTQSVVLGGASRIARRWVKQAEDTAVADIRAQQLAQMFDTAAASKLRERNADTFQEFAQSIADGIDGAPKSVFVDAATLADVFNQAGITEEQFVEMLPTGAQQMQSALASGGVVELPIGELMARVAGTGLEKQLLPHLRVEPDALSQIEAQQAGEVAQEFLQSEAQKVIAAAVDQTAVQASAEAVKQTVLSQLTTANRFTADVNEAYSTLVRDFYTATSSRLGITPEQMYDRYPLRVTAANAPAATLTVVNELEGVQDSASGESSASLEAQNRYRQELESGRVRVLVNEDGTARILRGVDAVDQRARKGQVIVQRGVGATELTVLEVGKGARKDVQARALIAAKKRIDEELAALPTAPIPVGEAEELEQSARTGGDTTHAALARELLAAMPVKPVLSSVALMAPAAVAPRFANQSELAAYFTKLNRGGARNLDSKATQKLIVDALHAEALHALADQGNAIGWYDRKVAAAMNIMAEVHPEILTDERSKFAFITLTAVTSNGMWTRDNFALAEKLYRTVWKEEWQFPKTVREGGQRAPQMASAFTLLNKLIGTHGLEAVRDFMQGEHTAAEVRDYAGAQGTFGELAETRVAGSLFLGPKIGGAYFQNLYGNFTPVTMDRWFMRTVNRVRGRMLTLPATLGDNLAELANQVLGGVDTLGVVASRIVDDIALFDTFTPAQKSDAVFVRAKLNNVRAYVGARHREFARAKPSTNGKKQVYGERTPENVLAKNIDMALNAGNDTPFSGGDRVWIRGVMQQTRERLAADGILIANADLQALYWYYEKDLYAKLVPKGRDVASQHEMFGTSELEESEEAEDYETAARYTVRRLQQQGLLAGLAGSARSGDGEAADAAGARKAPARQFATDPGAATLDLFQAPVGARYAPLIGLPGTVTVDGREVVFGPHQAAHDAAVTYMAQTGLPYNPPTSYVKVNPDRARRIAAAFESMAHAPNDPLVKAAYDAMVREVLAQWQVVKATGLKVEFIEGEDPYGNPRNAILDVVQNNHFWVYPTSAGYGAPLLNIGLDNKAGGAVTEEQIRAAIAATGADVAAVVVHQSDTEPTAVVRLSRALTPEEATAVSAALNQEAIAQFTGAGGGLYGPEAQKWGDFNPAFFLTLEGGRAAEANDNPLLAVVPGEQISGRPVQVNDIFRIVHDYFGHVKDGVGFRAGGEENAWRSHWAMFSPLARMALTTETRGQNSWVNFGPSAEANKTATTATTVYAAQKVGLLPSWVNQEGATDDPRVFTRNDVQPVYGVHFSKQPRTSLDGRFYGTGYRGAEGPRVAQADDARLRERVHFYVDEGNGIRPEDGVGPHASESLLPPLYDAKADREKLWRGSDLNATESRILDAGYAGYFVRNAFNGQGAAIVIGEQSRGLEAASIPSPSTTYTPPSIPQPYKRALMREELAKLDIAAVQTVAPSAALRAGTFQVDAAQLPAARDALAAQGITLPDSGNLAQGPRGSFNPKSLNITLLQNADLSTFLHESGHFFLEVLADVAAQPGAPADVAADMGAVLSWFGVKDVDTWNGMTLDEQRKHHERFAEAFEQYLFTGKAPSKELQQAFLRFRSWLVNVYKSLSDFLRGHDTQLTDEVRAVFDRMLATDAQIDETEAELSMLPHDDATLTAVETLQARSLRDLKWTLNATSKELKRLQTDVEEKRKTVRAEMTEVVRQLPEYAAQRWLKTGVLPDGTKSVGGKLSTAALKEMYGDGPAAPWRYVATNMLAAEDGLPPGVVADMFGFANGDALVRAIIGAEQEAHAIDGMTDKALLERYGDLATPAGMQRAALEAVHNEARARFVASQLKALAEGMNPREEVGRTRKGHAITVNALVGAAKQFAERVVAERRVLDLKPAVFTAAAARAARKADKAQAAGDVQAAIAAKREQLLNHYTAKRVMEAQAEVEKTLSWLKKFDKDTVRAKLSVDYLDQIDKLLERFDLRKGTSARDIDRRASLLEWVAAQEELGLQPVVPDALLNEARTTSYKQLTVEEFRGLADTVRNIEHLGRLKNKLLKAKDAREFAAIVDDIEQSIRDNATTTREPRVNAPTQAQRALDTARDFLSSHRKVSSIIRQLDGFKDNGPFWRAFVQTMNESADQEAVMREQATKSLAPIFDALLKTSRLGELAVVPGLATSLSLETRLVVALNWGNAANRQRVMDGDRWSEQQVNAILSTLTKPQLEFVQNVWAAIDDYWPAIKAKEERVSGLAPEKVEALPFAVNLADGTSVEMPGGYYPIKYDPDKSSKAEADTAAELTKQMLQGQYTRATTRRGHTKARVDKVNRAVRKDINVVFEHTTQVIHDLSWHEWLIDATRLLRAGSIDSAIRETMGPEMLRELKRGIEDIAAGDVPAQSGFERALNHMRQGVTIVGLGWNLMTGLLQPLGITQSMSRIGVKWVGKGLSRWVGDAVRMESAVARVYAQSSFMRLRGETFNRELNEIRNKVHGNKLSAVEASYFYLIQKLQIVADMPTWLGQYEKSMAEMDGDETTSIALADQAVRDSQASGHLSDLARIQRGGPLQKLFTTFYSYFSAAYNIGVESYRRTKFNDPLSVGVFAADMLLLAIVPSVLATLMRAALTGGADDEEELVDRLWRDQLNYLLGTMVGLREFGAAVQGFSGYQGPAGTRFFSEVAKLTKQAGQGEADAAFLKALNNTGGILFHYPAGQVNRTVEGFLALQEGETKNPLVLLVGPPKE